MLLSPLERGFITTDGWKYGLIISLLFCDPSDEDGVSLNLAVALEVFRPFQYDVEVRADTSGVLLLMQNLCFPLTREMSQ